MSGNASARSRVRPSRSIAYARPSSPTHTITSLRGCPETVAIAYEEMGLLKTEKHYNWFDPGSFWSGDMLTRAMLERQFAEKLVAEDSLVVLDGRLSFEPGPAHQVVGSKEASPLARRWRRSV